MTESDRMTQVRGRQEGTEGKGGKGKAAKSSKAETPSRPQVAHAEGRSTADRRPGSTPGTTPSRDPQLLARIQQRAYVLFEAAGYEHGHDLEHWLEAERQIIGPPDRSEK